MRKRLVSTARLRYTQGAVLGAFAYLFVFALVYALVSVDDGLDASVTDDIGRLQTELFEFGFPQPTPSEAEFVGWVLYNAHFVETVFAPDIQTPVDADGATAQSVNMLSEASTQIPAIVYYLLPVVVLSLCGYALARKHDADSVLDAARTGGSLVIGYFPLAVIGSLLVVATATGEASNVEVTVSAGPSLGRTVLVGFVFPAVFGIAGAVFALSDEE